MEYEQDKTHGHGAYWKALIELARQELSETITQTETQTNSEPICDKEISCN